jgi:hypothetical protein
MKRLLFDKRSVHIKRFTFFLFSLSVFQKDLKHFFYTILLFVFPSGLVGQPVKFEEQNKNVSQPFPVEKVYLHTDRTRLVQGDTIWFSGYSWFGPGQLPDTVSGALYVDLLDARGQVLQKRKLLIENGLSYGEFGLDKTMPPGRYALRAYTRRMQNPGAGEAFYQWIDIISSRENFRFEYSPEIVKQAGSDSLRVSFRFYELDPGGELNSYYAHQVNYTLKSGDKVLHAGNVQTLNTKEKVFACSLNKGDLLAVLAVSINDERLSYEKKFEIPLKERVSLQFFPEGGHLVNGLESKVAFKALGEDGLSREVKGFIKDNDENLVTLFESEHKGMGFFRLKPEKGKAYSAYLEHKGQRYKYAIPQALEQGSIVTAGYSPTGQKPMLTIQSTLPQTSTPKYVTGSSSGNVRFVQPVQLTNGFFQMPIPIEQFTEGIAVFTLLDATGKPECERLLYIDKEQRFKVEISPDTTTYGTRSKVSLRLKTTDLKGQPVNSSLSLAVVDKQQSAGSIEAGCITACKLLEPELRGNIEDVGFYFRDDSCNHNALDLLMLTQGYRKFVPDSTAPKYQPEQNLDITGRLEEEKGKTRRKRFDYRNINLTLLCPGGKLIDQTKPDSLGRFGFEVPLLYGKQAAVLQARRQGEKRFWGAIEIDPADNIPRFTLPKGLPLIQNAPVGYIQQIQAARKEELPVTGSDVNRHIVLDEVTVMAKDKKWYKNYEARAEKIADMDSLDPKGNRYKNVFELLIREFGAMPFYAKGLNTVMLPVKSSALSYYFPIYMINGEVYCDGKEIIDLLAAAAASANRSSFINVGRIKAIIDDPEKETKESAEMKEKKVTKEIMEERIDVLIALQTKLSAMKINEIKRIMVLPLGEIPAYYASDKMKRYGIQQSLVVIETYSNNSYRGDPTGIKTFLLDGLDTPREFYSPIYEGPQKDSPVYDGRATLYWNPSAKTGSGGEATVEFYTGERETELQVIVNGMEVTTGNPGQGQAVIEVKKIPY